MNRINYNKISRIGDIMMLPKGLGFKYAIETEPFDFWHTTLSPEQLIGNYRQEEFNYFETEVKQVEELVEQIKEIVFAISNEQPFKIAFTSIPTQCGSLFELVGLAKIYNNGTSYVFSNDLNYMKYLENKLRW